MKLWFLVPLFLGLAAPALAFHEGASLGSNRQDEVVTVSRTASVRIEGSLICDMGSENQSAGCILKILDTKTGRVYRLLAAREAMELFSDGKKKVAIEGTPADSEDSIQVFKATAL